MRPGGAGRAGGRTGHGPILRGAPRPGAPGSGSFSDISEEEKRITGQVTRHRAAAARSRRTPNARSAHLQRNSHSAERIDGQEDVTRKALANFLESDEAVHRPRRVSGHLGGAAGRHEGERHTFRVLRQPPPCRHGVGREGRIERRLRPLSSSSAGPPESASRAWLMRGCGRPAWDGGKPCASVYRFQMSTGAQQAQVGTAGPRRVARGMAHDGRCFSGAPRACKRADSGARKSPTHDKIVANRTCPATRHGRRCMQISNRVSGRAPQCSYSPRLRARESGGH